MMLDTEPVIPLSYFIGMKAFKKRVTLAQLTRTVNSIPSLPFRIVKDGITRTRSFSSVALTSADFLQKKQFCLQALGFPSCINEMQVAAHLSSFNPTRVERVGVELEHGFTIHFKDLSDLIRASIASHEYDGSKISIQPIMYLLNSNL
jgi:hypothetical protein